MVHSHGAIGATILDVQEAVIQIRLIVAATHRLKFTRTDASAALKLEGS